MDDVYQINHKLNKRIVELESYQDRASKVFDKNIDTMLAQNERIDDLEKKLAKFKDGSLKSEVMERIAELEIESANWHQEYMESLNVRDNLEDENKDLHKQLAKHQAVIRILTRDAISGLPIHLERYLAMLQKWFNEDGSLRSAD